MGDLNLTGKVLEISDVQTFQRKDGTAGKVGNLLLVSRPLNNWSSLYAMILFIFLC